MHRKKWIQLIAFFSLLFVVDRGLYMLLDAGFRRIEVGETGGMVNRALAVKADVVVLGSSRAWRHYDTEVLSNAFKTTAYNAGCDGQGVPYVRGMADLLLHKAPPHFLLIDVDPVFLISRRFLDRVTILAPYIDESDMIAQMIYYRGFFEPVKYLSWSFRYNSKALSILHNLGRQDQTKNGFHPLDKTLSVSSLHASLKREKHLDCDEDAVLDPYTFSLLCDTVHSAKVSGVQVVMVVSPRWRADFQSDPAHSSIFKRLADLANREGVPYITITQENAPVFRDMSLFADPAHLNRKGAHIFTQLLVERLRDKGVDVLPATSQPASESSHGTD